MRAWISLLGLRDIFWAHLEKYLWNIFVYVMNVLKRLLNNWSQISRLNSNAKKKKQKQPNRITFRPWCSHKRKSYLILKLLTVPSVIRILIKVKVSCLENVTTRSAGISRYFYSHIILSFFNINYLKLSSIEWVLVLILYGVQEFMKNFLTNYLHL